MNEEQEVGAAGAAGKVTLADVVAALGENGDPFQSSAAKIRATLGRGGFSTIQKHLDAIRASKIATQPSNEEAVPPCPADLVAAMWAAAWSAAQVKTLTRLEQISVERDGLTARLQAQAFDIDEMTRQLDEQAILLATAEAAAGDAQRQSDQSAAVLAAALAQVAVSQAENERVTVAAAAAAALVERDREIERQTMAATIDRQVEQLAETKALLISISITNSRS